MPAPLDTVTPHLRSLESNQLCGLSCFGQDTYTAEGITKLCEGLKGSAVISLKCAAPLNVRQCPLTRLLSHRFHRAPRSQSRTQLPRSRGRHCAGCRPQRDEDHQPQVRCRPRSVCFRVSVHWRASLSAPGSALARSLEVNNIGDEGAIALAAILKKTKITCLKCAPKRLLSWHRPLTLLNTRLRSRAHSLRDNRLGSDGGAALAESLKGNSALQYLKQAAATPKRLLFCQCPLTSLLSHHIHSAPRLQSRAEQTHRRGQTGGQRRRGQHRPHPRLVQAAAVRHATLTALVTSVVASPPILASRTPIWPDMAGTLEGGGGVWHQAKTRVPNTHANVQHSPQRNYQVPGFVPIEAP